MKQSILIVDDQFGIRLLLQEVFKKDGYKTYTAENGKQALEIAKKNKPSLVLLDFKLPGMDGIEILKRLKEMDSEIKVIMMTAYGELDMIQEAIDLGAITYYSKPFDIDEVRNAVKKYVPVTTS